VLLGVFIEDYIDLAYVCKGIVALRCVNLGCAGALIWRICARGKVAISGEKWLKNLKFRSKVLKSGWVLGWF
jgi:hypothetical protein